jgi:hypothetical protein
MERWRDGIKNLMNELLKRLEALTPNGGVAQKVNPLKVIKDYENRYYQVTGKKLLLQTDDWRYLALTDTAYCLNHEEEMREDHGLDYLEILVGLAKIYEDTIGVCPINWPL